MLSLFVVTSAVASRTLLRNLHDDTSMFIDVAQTLHAYKRKRESSLSRLAAQINRTTQSSKIFFVPPITVTPDLRAPNREMGIG